MTSVVRLCNRSSCLHELEEVRMVDGRSLRVNKWWFSLRLSCKHIVNLMNFSASSDSFTRSDHRIKQVKLKNSTMREDLVFYRTRAITRMYLFRVKVSLVWLHVSCFVLRVLWTHHSVAERNCHDRFVIVSNRAFVLAFLVLVVLSLLILSP